MRRLKQYPVLETELNDLRRWALLSLIGVGMPFLIWSVLSLVHRLKHETTFEEAAPSAE